MQRLMVYLTVFSLFLAACGAPAGPAIVPTEVAPTEAPATVEPPTPSPTEPPAAADIPAVAVVQAALAELLGIDLEQIRVVTVESVEWTDSCFGIAYIDAICAQAMVPGYRIVLEASGQTFEYRTNADASSFALAPAAIVAGAESAAQAAVAALARALGLPEYRVTVVSSAAVEWTDSCLGIARIDASCLVGAVPGYRLILEADGLLFEFRTNADGSQLAIAPVGETLAALPAVQAAVAALSQARGLEAYQIYVVAAAPREWPDSCLGLTLPGLACAEVITPGYAVVLEDRDGRLYAYNVNQDGTNVQPASVALTWKRMGGIAGFCNELIVYRSGEVFALNCAPEDVVSGSLAGALSEPEIAQFNEWLAGFGTVNLVQDDGAVADSMHVELAFTGTGTAEASEEEQQALLEWAQSLYGQLQPAG